jgi:hypothetical protein
MPHPTTMYQGTLGEISPTCMPVTLVILLFKHKSLQQLEEREREKKKKKKKKKKTPSALLNACVIIYM